VSIPQRKGDTFEEGSLDFEGSLIEVLLISERDTDELVDDLHRTIDVIDVSVKELQQGDLDRYLHKESKLQLAERYLQDIGIAVLKYLQDEVELSGLDNLISLLNRMGTLELPGISQVFPAAIDGVLTALQELRDKEELPDIQDMNSLSVICSILSEGLMKPEYTYQLDFTAQIEEKLFELRHDAQKSKVGDLLLRRGVLTESDIADISEKQKSPEYQEARFGEIAIREKNVPPHEVIAALQAQKAVTPPREPDHAAQRAASAESTFIRVPVAKVEGLMDMLSELLILNSQSEQLAVKSSANDSQMMSTLSQTAKLIREIQNLSMSLRLVEIRPTLHRLTRIARDTAAELNKRVTINIEGEETEIDRSAAEKLFDPLMHLVRNAVSHGIEENVADRIRLGKKTDGQVTVRAYSRQGSVFIEVIDDGKGIDYERVLAKARRVGLADEYTEYSNDEIIRFLFMPGFSTQEQVNSISGRGVGMNVVEEEMRRLGGKVDVSSRKDEGSVFSLRIPMNLAVVNGTIIEVCGERFIIPTLFIKEFATEQTYRWVSMQGRNRAIQIRNENVIPVLEASSVFGYGYDAASDTTRNEVVIMELESKQLAFPVDRIVARQEIVSKPLDREFASLSFISGASIMGDGMVCLILDVEAMYKAAGM
ncbi:MAG: chemotaxis protein CheW, partial [Symbiobacteriaceae bacterium]|nr:chemotaxis protein CheW [Symbiobacteriaceae bacterium]